MLANNRPGASVDLGSSGVAGVRSVLNEAMDDVSESMESSS